MEEINYKQYQLNQSQKVKSDALVNSAPRDKLPKNFTGRDIIKKMQYNWYKDLVSPQKESMFQEIGKQILK